jgi:Protein-arginine deiminase (PAD)
MPGFSLFADFNRSGRLERTVAEHAAGAIDPGAIVVANLDNDNRRLPATVAAATEAIIDANRDAKPATDNEPLPLLLAPDRGAGQHHLRIAVFAWLVSRLGLLDERKRRVPRVLGSLGAYDFGATNTDKPLFLEARTLAGSPLVGIPSLSPRRFEINRMPPERDERRFVLSLISRPLAGGDPVTDNGTFMIAPWIMIDGTAPLERLYIVDTGDNHPSVADIRAGLPDAGKLFIVPNSVANNDTWLQDQFEVGAFHTPNGISLVLLHLPRLRRNYLGRGATSGLPNFVRSHFPSREVGVFDEFWQRSIPVDVLAGNRVNLQFEQSGKVREAMLRPFLLRNELLNVAFSVLETNPLRTPQGNPLPFDPFVNIAQALTDISTWFPLVDAEIDREIPRARTEFAEMLRGHKEDLRSRRALSNQAVQALGNGVRVTAQDPPQPDGSAGRVVWNEDISIDTANQLEERLRQMHDSQNYGGNMELGPPTDGAPYGQIFIGNGVRGSEEFVDTELLNFLDKQRVQPLIQVDTSWLEVAHVDEIFSFVPNRGRGGTHAIIMNSTRLALDILDFALRQYIAGLPSSNDFTERPSGILRRELNRGTSPVTAMFRGKQWNHSHVAGTPEIQPPPRLYQVMAEFYGRGISVHNVPWRPGQGADRVYPAEMTVRELLWFESSIQLPDPNSEEGATLSTNELIDQDKLQFLQAQLQDFYPNLPLLLVPTIYDVVRNPSDSTGAYTPNAANLIVADDRLLFPKPFGPRVRPVDAIAIISRAFRESGMEALLSRLSERWLRDNRNRLLGVTQWFRAEDLATGSGTHASRLALEFKDGFGDSSQEEIANQIINSNRSAFRRGDLRSGFHLLRIPEDTVDLFEVAIALAVSSLGIQWRFVDSWTYHLTSGEIHCGTNALRRPSFRGRQPWWEFYFRAPAQT